MDTSAHTITSYNRLLNSPTRREALLHETLEADLVGGRLALGAAAHLLALVAIVEAERRRAQRAAGVQLAAVRSPHRRRRLAERAQLVQTDATVTVAARPTGRRASAGVVPLFGGARQHHIAVRQ